MDIWKNVLETIEENVDEQTFENWFKPIKPIYINNDSISLEIPNKFFLDWFQKNYLALLKSSLSYVTKKEYTVKFSFSTNKDILSHPTKKYQKESSFKQKKHIFIGDTLNKNHSFDNFIVGTSNQFAHAAALSVAKNPSVNYNPLFIYGGVGLGKTHLLSAIGNYLVAHNINVCFISSENFMNELINSIRYDRMPIFREKFRTAEVLLIDDIQFIAGKERTQEEFFHTFNSLFESQRQIVMSSDKFPRDINFLEERLRSRFEWGLIADIQPPEIETKIAILKSKAYTLNIPLPDDVCFFLASSINSNIRELEGSLIRIGAFASLTEKEITLSTAKEILKNIIPDNKSVIDIETIQKAVTNHFKIKISDLNSNKRQRVYALPRQIGMYLSRKLTLSSFPEIGTSFGGRDHSTVIHAVNKIKKLIESDKSIKGIIESIENKL
ncbi:MAG: chromosomal replication initiator protein DnaA [Thermodesulfobacteriota bacterium]|nr:chromosomal replication initiator protein DnaA [Thermodesulfobacteriota bacterium]